MRKMAFVMGSTATGKTHFIENYLSNDNSVILNVYDYQLKAYDEAGFGNSIPNGAWVRCLLKANDMHLRDIIEELSKGHDVIAEQTFLKAKRRIYYLDKIRNALDVRVEIYVMHPSDEQWASNIKKRELGATLQAYKEQTERELEFPNPSEGFDAIYEVIDNDVKLRMDELRPGIVEQARMELKEEADRICKEDKKRKERKDLIDSMKTRPFWHYCEVCGKKEYITAKEAFDLGWDYPPDIGHFRVLGPRTCGVCPINATLFWRINTEKKVSIPIVIEGMLTKEERITWHRIKAEPESLLEEETEEVLERYEDCCDISSIKKP